MANANLVAEPCAGGLADFAATTLEEQRAAMPGFLLLDLEHASLDGRPAIRTLLTYRLDHAQLVVDQWLAVEHGVAWCLSCGTDTFDLERDATRLEAVAAGVELPGPPLDAAEPVAPRPRGDAEPPPPLPEEPSVVAPEPELLALVEAGAPTPDGPRRVLLDVVAASTRRLELHVDDTLALGWIAGDAAVLLTPEPEGRARLARVPLAALPVELATRIPAGPAVDGRDPEPLELPPGVLAALLATRKVPDAVLPGSARDALAELAAGLGAWWRLEIHGDVAAVALEGLAAADGPWRIDAGDSLVRLEPTRPRDLFVALCAALA